jgi:transcriptional regulator GlxA family with amidase domain
MRTVALLAYDGAQVLDLMGPAEVFYVADQLAGGGTYCVNIVSADGRDTVSASVSGWASPLRSGSSTVRSTRS